MRGSVSRSNLDLKNVFIVPNTVPAVSDELLEKTLSEFFKYETPYLDVQSVYETMWSSACSINNLGSLEAALYMRQMVLSNIVNTHKTYDANIKDVRESLNAMSELCGSLFEGNLAYFLHNSYCVTSIQLELFLLKNRMIQSGLTEEQVKKIVSLNQRDIDTKLCGLPQSSVFGEESVDPRTVDMSDTTLEDSVVNYINTHMHTLTVNNIALEFISVFAGFISKPETGKITNIQYLLSSVGCTVDARLLHSFLVMLDVFAWGSRFIPSGVTDSVRHLRESFFLGEVYNEICLVGELMKKLNDLYTIEDLVLIPEVLDEAIGYFGDTTDTLHLQRLKGSLHKLNPDAKEKYLCTYLVNYNR